ncbi:DNA-directed RNA polymerase III subunit RPC5-like isoform X1 [Lineus longissimus]|uniref:DNA-directed RNA polymerase III subunit RPC5-like isoform X1 n=1 Tax=Lineus longissimus TaxID=88925 RepID=UPI00315C4CA4
MVGVTLDVFLSKTLAENLYLFQYPVRPATLPYDDVPHLSARMKPKQQRVELELSVNTGANSYCRSKGEQLALNVDGNDPGEGSFYSSDVMDKYMLSSSANVVDMSRYAVGMVKEGELHLTPLHGVMQLKPSFGYLDQADTRQEGAGGAGDAGDDDEEEEVAKPVQVKFGRPESEEAKARRLASYQYLHKTQEEEHWVKCNFNSADSEKSMTDMDQLFSNRSREVFEFHKEPQDYLKDLIPPESDKELEKPAMPTNVLSMTQLKTMTLGDQIRALLTNAKVIKFSQLMALLPRETDPVSCLRSLQQVAMLVQGCWVVKSEILYPKDTCSPHSGIPAEVLCRGRDYVMWRFTQNRVVMRKDISSVIKLPAEDVKDLLDQMSRIKINLGWEFLMGYDKEFVDRHPDIVQRQQMLWDAKYQQLTKVLKITKEMEKKVKADHPVPASPRRRRSSSRSKSRSENHSISESDTDVDNSSKMDIDHTDSITNHVNGENSAVPMETDNEVMPSVELKTELLNFIQEKLYSRYVMTLTDVKRLFSIKLAQCPPGHVLAGGVPDKLLEQSIVEVGGVKLQNQWPPNSKEEPMFALAKTGDKLDQIRAIMLDMFKDSFKIRSSVLKSRIESELSMNASDNDIKKLLKDYCISKGSLWYLKGTSTES